MKLTICTRGSQLALWQTHHVRDRLQQLHADLQVSVEILRTTGDRINDVPLSRIGDRGLFTKELDRAVLDGRADLAVHSLKDIPTSLPHGLGIIAVLEREDPGDAFIPAPGRPRSLDALPAGAVVGTSSLRRRALLLDRRPDLQVADLRGNLDTRLERVHDGEYDAAVLALAGLRRLRQDGAVAQRLGAPEWLPAAGQGAIAVVCRTDDRNTMDALRPLDHVPTRAAVLAERAFLSALEGGCQIPIGCLASVADDALTLHGFVAGVRSGRLLRGSQTGPAGDPIAAGLALATSLREQGADALLDEVRGAGDELAPGASAP